MKIHRVVQMLGATTSTGKLADDMYDLGHKDYYSEAEDRYIPISHMDFQHLVRAFVKQNDEVKYYKKLAEDNFISSVNDSETSNVWKERYEHELKMAEYWKDAFYKKDVIKGCGYVFSEIPNDTDGQEFVDNMKKYFNKKSYKMRVRGQHVKPELRGTGVTSHGQNIDESTHLRVYIDIK